MFLRSKLFKILSIMTIVFGLAVFALADTIRLKDGSVIKGKIVSFDNGQFVIVIGDGARQRQMRFFADEIESIVFDNQAVPTDGSNSVLTNTSTETPKRPSYSEKKDGDSTIITVGSAPRNTDPRTTSPPANTSTVEDEILDDEIIDDGEIIDDDATVPTTPTNASRPIQIKVKVLADNTSNGWTNAGWVVRKGQRIRIVGGGRISLGNGRYSGPRGISTLPDENKLIKSEPTGSLIAVIGDDNNDFIAIGEDLEFVAERDGALFLGVNEGVLSDNSGSFEVTIEISTAAGD
jgi:hypothetical protein